MLQVKKSFPFHIVKTVQKRTENNRLSLIMERKIWKDIFSVFRKFYNFYNQEQIEAVVVRSWKIGMKEQVGLDVISQWEQC